MAQIPKTGTLYISDVKNALGETTTDLGRLCKSPKINPWAKYKPVRLADPFPNPNSDWWKAADGNCGFSIPTLSSPSDAGVANWNYIPPSGGPVNPYRLGDFRGYDDSATMPLYHTYGRVLEVNKQAYPSGMWNIFLPVVWNEKSLNWNDFSIGECYLTAQIISKTASGYGLLVSADEKIKNGFTDIKIDLNLLNTGNYYLRFFLSEAKQTGGGAVASVFYPIPQNSETPAEISLSIVSKKLFSISTLDVSWDLNGAFVGVDELRHSGGNRLSSRGGVCFKCVAINDSSNSTSISLNTISLYGLSFHGTYELVNPAFYDSNKKQITSIAVPSGGRVEFYIYSYNILILRNSISTTVSNATTVLCGMDFRQYSGQTYSVLGQVDFYAIYGENSIRDDIWMQ